MKSICLEIFVVRFPAYWSKIIVTLNCEGGVSLHWVFVNKESGFNLWQQINRGTKSLWVQIQSCALLTRNYLGWKPTRLGDRSLLCPRNQSCLNKLQLKAGLFVFWQSVSSEDVSAVHETVLIFELKVGSSPVWFYIKNRSNDPFNVHILVHTIWIKPANNPITQLM